MSPRKVVVTGVGVITPIGLTVSDFWTNLTAGKSGVDLITHFDASDYPVKLAAQVNGFDPLQYMDAKTASRMGRFAQFAVAAATMAVDMAGLDMKQERAERVGVTIGSIGQVHALQGWTDAVPGSEPKRIDPLIIQKLGPHIPAIQTGRLIGARGPNLSIQSACASGSDALRVALNQLRSGYADVMIAGGTDDTVAPISIVTMGTLRTLSKDTAPGRAPRPFDKERNGTVVGEGAGILVLETWEHARLRDAPILAELAGAGASFDAYSATAPDPEGQALAIKTTLDDAGLAPGDIEYVNAHGTGTRLNDSAETQALKLVLGDHAYKVPVSSNKSMIGHLSAAAGAVEAVATVLTIVNGVIPPTINYLTPDPECDLDYVPNVAREARVGVCLSNSFGLGGQNCSLVFRRFERDGD